MKLVEMKCKNCGNKLKLKPNQIDIDCEYCHAQYKFDDGIQHIKYDDMEQAGYELEKGKIKARTEAKEQKPVETIRDRRRKKASTTKPKVERTIPNKFKWGVFEGANMSVNEITEALNTQGITTEEQWNNRTDEEMERVLQCCGAI